jgi:hypothetical protein
MALDAFGDMREELLHKQKEAMVARAIASQRDRTHSMHRRSGQYALPGRLPSGRAANGC